MQTQPTTTSTPDLPLFFDVPYMFAASKRLSHRRTMLAMAEAIANVFTDERFSTVELRARFASRGPAFKAMLSELTSEGSSFYSARFFNWLGKTNSWTTQPRTREKLESVIA